MYRFTGLKSETLSRASWGQVLKDTQNILFFFPKKFCFATPEFWSGLVVGGEELLNDICPNFQLYLVGLVFLP